MPSSPAILLYVFFENLGALYALLLVKSRCNVHLRLIGRDSGAGQSRELDNILYFKYSHRSITINKMFKVEFN